MYVSFFYESVNSFRLEDFLIQISPGESDTVLCISLLGRSAVPSPPFCLLSCFPYAHPSLAPPCPNLPPLWPPAPSLPLQAMWHNAIGSAPKLHLELYYFPAKNTHVSQLPITVNSNTQWNSLSFHFLLPRSPCLFLVVHHLIQQMVPLSTQLCKSKTSSHSWFFSSFHPSI